MHVDDEFFFKDEFIFLIKNTEHYNVSGNSILKTSLLAMRLHMEQKVSSPSYYFLQLLRKTLNRILKKTNYGGYTPENVVLWRELSLDNER